MVELIVRILINAAALLVAIKVLPSNLISFNYGNDWWKLLLPSWIGRRSSPARLKRLCEQGRDSRPRGAAAPAPTATSGCSSPPRVRW